jgi:hypothetical protein
MPLSVNVLLFDSLLISPMDPKIKSIVNAVVVIAVVLWLLSVFIGFGSLSTVHVGRIN